MPRFNHVAAAIQATKSLDCSLFYPSTFYTHQIKLYLRMYSTCLHIPMCCHQTDVKHLLKLAFNSAATLSETDIYHRLNEHMQPLTHTCSLTLIQSMEAQSARLLEQINAKNKRRLKKNWREDGGEEEWRKWVDPGDYETKTVANKDNMLKYHKRKTCKRLEKGSTTKMQSSCFFSCYLCQKSRLFLDMLMHQCLGCHTKQSSATGIHIQLRLTIQDF